MKKAASILFAVAVVVYAMTGVGAGAAVRANATSIVAQHNAQLEAAMDAAQ